METIEKTQPNDHPEAASGVETPLTEWDLDFAEGDPVAGYTGYCWGTPNNGDLLVGSEASLHLCASLTITCPLYIVVTNPNCGSFPNCGKLFGGGFQASDCEERNAPKTDGNYEYLVVLAPSNPTFPDKWAAVLQLWYDTYPETDIGDVPSPPRIRVRNVTGEDDIS